MKYKFNINSKISELHLSYVIENVLSNRGILYIYQLLSLQTLKRIRDEKISVFEPSSADVRNLGKLGGIDNDYIQNIIATLVNSIIVIDDFTGGVFSYMPVENGNEYKSVVDKIETIDFKGGEKLISDYIDSLVEGSKTFDISEILRVIFSNISPIQKDIFQSYCGIKEYGDVLSFDDIAKKYGLTVESLNETSDIFLGFLRKVLGKLKDLNFVKSHFKTLLDGENITGYGLLDFDKSDDDFISGKFLALFYGFTCYDPYQCLFLGNQGRPSTMVLVYDSILLDKNIIDLIIKGVDNICIGCEKDHEINRDLIITKIVNDDEDKLLQFLQNPGYSYFLEKYLGFEYGAWSSGEGFLIKKSENAKKNKNNLEKDNNTKNDIKTDMTKEFFESNFVVKNNEIIQGKLFEDINNNEEQIQSFNDINKDNIVNDEPVDIDISWIGSDESGIKSDNNSVDYSVKEKSIKKENDINNVIGNNELSEKLKIIISSSNKYFSIETIMGYLGDKYPRNLVLNELLNLENTWELMHVVKFGKEYYRHR